MEKKYINQKLVLVVLCLISIMGLFSAHAADPVIVRGVDLQDLSVAAAPIGLSDQSPLLINNTSINLTFGSGLAGNPTAQQAFAQAAARWSAVLADPVSLSINVDYQSLGSGILGQTNATMLSGGYSTTRNLVANGGDSGASWEGLLPQLPTINQWSMYIPQGFTWNGASSLTQANYLALGGSHIVPSDGSITFSSNYSWDFDPSNGVNPGTFDFEGVAVHEMGHILGFISNVDSMDYYLQQGLTGNPYPTPLDFFRFQTGDLGSGFNFTNTPRIIAPGGAQSFYYGGSVSMSTGAYYGDGSQASHWKDNLNLGVMDPTAAPGEVLNISTNDLIAMDLIGWNVVPEPSTIVLLFIAGLVFSMARIRRQR